MSTPRDRREMTVGMNADVAKQLDEIVQLSDGVLDRARAAELALSAGMPLVLRRAAVEAARNIAKCLRCGAQMHGAEAASIAFKGCEECGGIWLDNDSASRILKELPTEAIELARRATASTGAHSAQTGKLPCPLCAETMDHRHMELAQVTLDVCAKHGTWYDHGELIALIDLLTARRHKQTELERAIRSVEIDAEIQQLHDMYNTRFKEGYNLQTFMLSNFYRS